MSFEDTIDDYRLAQKNEALEKAQRLAIRQIDIGAVKKLGYLVTSHNGGLHVKIRWLEYWPSTGRWNNPRRKRRGKLGDGESLLDLVRGEVGEAGPVMVKAALAGGAK